MTRKEKISALAERLGLYNDPILGLDEADITIERLDFYDTDNQLVDSVEATSQNKAGRLYFQQFSSEGDLIVHLHELFVKAAKDFFAEIWTEEPNPAQRLLYGIRMYDHVRIILKPTRH